MAVRPLASFIQPPNGGNLKVLKEIFVCGCPIMHYELCIVH